MCYMVLVGLPKFAQQKWIQRLSQPLRAWSTHYDGLSSQMGHFETVIVGTGMCSCDLFNRGGDEDVYAKYSKKGWSKNKIERAIENRKKANLHAGLHPDLRNWLADAATDLGEAFLFVHWDSNELNYEQRVTISPEEMREQTVSIKEEQIIHVRAI